MKNYKPSTKNENTLNEHTNENQTKSSQTHETTRNHQGTHKKPLKNNELLQAELQFYFNTNVTYKNHEL